MIWSVIVFLVTFWACQGRSLQEKRLMNKHLRVVAMPKHPFFVWKCPNDAEWTDEWKMDCPNGEDYMYSGILWDLLMFMKKAKNLSYTIIGIDDATWAGTCYDSNNCTGMIGRVNRREADLALGLFYNN